MSEVTGTFCHVSGTSLASRRSVDDALARVHEAAQLGSAAFHDLGEANAALGDGHPPDLLRAEDAELDPLDRPDRRLRVASVNGRHGWVEALTTGTSASERNDTHYKLAIDQMTMQTSDSWWNDPL